MMSTSLWNYSLQHATGTDWRNPTEDDSRSGDGDGDTPIRRDRTIENRGAGQSEKLLVAAFTSSLQFD
jgi:hypothetical protein